MQNTQKKNPFAIMEEEVLDFWQKNNIFQKSVENPPAGGASKGIFGSAQSRDYVFYDGPPFATGLPHYGHIVASIIKDVVPRYQTMKGYRVERKWGWDCHGLPIENIVEKELDSKSKKDIEEIGVEKFNEMCRSKVLTFAEDWKTYIKKLGRWVDMENDYKTMDLDFMESVWWVFKQLWDKGYIYKDYRSMHICPRCETTLSQSEVAEGYKDVKDLSAIAKFELVDEPGTFILAWTTTPWTLIGNTALAVGEKIEYIKTKIRGEQIIVAKDRLKNVIDMMSENIVIEGPQEEIRSKELVGKKYKPLFNYYADDEKLENRENGWKIYAGDFVSTEEGTGIVHIAPVFGEDDMNLGKKHALPFVQHVEMDGNFKAEVKDFQGFNVKPKEDVMATDVEIIKYLAHHNLLFHKEKYEHSYPHCWRCDTPLLNYATSSWFVNVLKMKKQLLKHAKNINWSPEHIKEGRWGNWLEGARDWSISRQRFWASVIPIWECECGEQKVIGSVAELEELSGQKVQDLHKHVVDEIKFPCAKCKKQMVRIPDVFDCWFESGSMPYAQMHYPFENQEKFENNFPAQFIAEGADQTRAWFYYLHVLAVGIFDKESFKNVIVNGIVLAEDGKKMAKKLKNYPDPMDVFNQYGADALRYYLLTSPVMLADTLCFSEKGVQEALRKVGMILWNVVKFYEMFKEDYGQKINTTSAPKSKNVLDKWIVARLNQLIEEATTGMANYNLPKASRPIVGFIDDLSTWYIRRSRDRFKSDDEADKQAALETTGFVLLELSKVMAPFTPFIAEQVWQKATEHNFSNENKSVHLEAWPSQAKIKNNELEIIEEMEKVRKIVELGLAKRDEAGIKVRQPLQELKVQSAKLKVDDIYLDLIKDEVNVKNIVIAKGKEELSVKLDTEITEDLKLEGVKRELVRFINNLRKDAELTIQDRAKIYFETEDRDVKEAIQKHKEEILKDTLGSDITEGVSEVDIEKAVKVNGGEVKLGLKKV